MTPILVHPVILQHPGRIEQMEWESGMRVVYPGKGHPQLVPAIYRPQQTQPENHGYGDPEAA